MKNKILIGNVLSLAVVAAIAACSSSREEAATKEAPSIAAASANAAYPAADATAGVMEEVILTGSRVAASSSAQAASRRMALAVRPSIAPSPNTENYANIEANGIQRVSQQPVSTFSIDVDTGSYSNVRRFLNSGQLPPADAVRTEELVNYFSYEYPRASTDAPFSFVTEISASPWNSGKHLLHIGIQATEPDAVERPHSNLVFLVDVSGSMESPDKLDLLKTSLRLLTRQLGEDDSIAIVVYAGASGVVLEPTAGDQTGRIIRALDQLQAGGSTNGAAGIQLAYQLAEENFIEGGINRVLLATDGDFNVGLTNFDDLKELIEKKRKSGISLTTLGFGTGNYNDHLMEQLADAGNGNYSYIDSVNEARKVLVDELSSTLQTVAKDVKVQIEFNPALVSEYRLVGYENRVLAREDFNNDRVDAGEIGAGHEVTALYEISLVGSVGQSVDPLRYGSDDGARTANGNTGELAYLKLRYKDPEGETSRLLERALRVEDIIDDPESTSSTYRFSAAVAGFSQLLRDDSSLGDFGYDEVLALAGAAREDDELGYRSEFINLVKTAQALAAN